MGAPDLSAFEMMANAKIRKAMEDGQFDNLPGRFVSTRLWAQLIGQARESPSRMSREWGTAQTLQRINC